MIIDQAWDALTPHDWTAFAQSLFAELRGPADDPSPCGAQVVQLNFIASAENQWEFIHAAIACATTEDDLRQLAAGPIEHLLGWPGAARIDRIELEAASNATFARALTGVWRCGNDGEARALTPPPID